MAKQRNRQTRRRWMAWLTVVVLALSVAFLWGYLRHTGVLDGVVVPRLVALKWHLRRLGWLGPMVLIAILVVHSVLVVVPIEVPMLAAISIYGTVAGIVYTWIGSMLSAYAAYFLAGRLGRPLLDRMMKPTALGDVHRAVTSLGDLGLLLLRFIPVVSFNALNYACGLAEVPLWSFTWTSALGILFTDALMALLYRGVVNSAWGMVIAVAGACVAGLWVMWRWQRRFYAQEEARAARAAAENRPAAVGPLGGPQQGEPRG